MNSIIDCSNKNVKTLSDIQLLCQFLNGRKHERIAKATRLLASSAGSGFVSDNASDYQLLSEKEAFKIAAAVELAKRGVINSVRRGMEVRSSSKVASYLREKYMGFEHEIFGVLFLNGKNCLIAAEEMFRGTINQCAVYPREIVKMVIKHNATSVILFHNHPTGETDPSSADKTITDVIKTALDTIDVRVLDHVIVGKLSACYSFADNGLL